MCGMGCQCYDTLAPSHLNRDVTGPGVVATDAESHKLTKYETISRTHCFVPIAVETLGGVGALGDDASRDSILERLGRSN